MSGHLTEAIIDELAEVPTVEESLDPEIREHLSACTQCQEEVALAKRVLAELDAVPKLEAPPVLLANVMARVERKQIAARGRAVLAASLAGLMALAVVVIWLIGGGAAGLVVEALQAARALDLISRIAGSIWRTIPVELVLASTAVLLVSSAALGGLVGRVRRAGEAEAKVGSLAE